MDGKWSCGKLETVVGGGGWLETHIHIGRGVIPTRIVRYVWFVVIAATVGSGSDMTVHSVVSGSNVIILVLSKPLSRMLRRSSRSSQYGPGLRVRLLACPRIVAIVVVFLLAPFHELESSFMGSPIHVVH